MGRLAHVQVGLTHGGREPGFVGSIGALRRTRAQRHSEDHDLVFLPQKEQVGDPYGSFPLVPSWKPSLQGLTLPSEVPPTPPERLIPSPLVSEARDRCQRGFFSSSSLFLAKRQPHIKAHTPTCPAAPRPTTPHPRPACRRRAGRRTQQAAGTESKRKQLPVGVAKGDRQPRQAAAGRAGPSPDIAQTNLCPGFHHLGQAPPREQGDCEPSRPVPSSWNLLR